MKQNTKDWIQYISGASLIASAIVLAVTSLLQYERIAEGVNTYAGIAISGGLSVFGVAAYFVNQLSQFKTEIRTILRVENVTFLHAAEDRSRNSASVLREWVLE